MKSKILAATVLALSFIMACTAPPQLQKPVNGENKENEVVITDCRESATLKKGQHFILKLPVSAGTGYQWQVSKQQIPDILKSNNKEEAKFEELPQKNSEEPPMVGQRMYQIFDFSAEKTGSATLNLVLVRPFDPNNIDSQCSILITVN